MKWLTRQGHFFAHDALLLILFALVGTAGAAPNAQASALATQGTVGHVVRLDGLAVARIVSVIHAKLICHGCLTTGGDITSPKSGAITYASSGSGAFITPDGYVLTADHVVDHGASNPEDVDLIEQPAVTDIAKQLNDGASAAGLVVFVGCVLALLIVTGAIVLAVILLARRKRIARAPVAVPTGAAYPMQQMQQMTPAAGQGAYPGYPGSYGQPAAPAMPFQPQQKMYPAQAYQQQAPGSPAAPITPMRRCLNGHIVSDPAAIFCAECGAGIHLSHP